MLSNPGQNIESDGVRGERDRTPDPALDCDHTTGCITCGDEAVAMTVLKLDSDRGLALCTDDGGRRETVETALVEAVEGDVLMVHAATAIARVERSGAGSPAEATEAGRRGTVSERGSGRPAEVIFT